LTISNFAQILATFALKCTILFLTVEPEETEAPDGTDAPERTEAPDKTDAPELSEQPKMQNKMVAR